MINLHERYGHYLNTNKKHEITGEKVLTYGWDDDGSKLIGYYVITENHKMVFCPKGNLKSKEAWQSGLLR